MYRSFTKSSIASQFTNQNWLLNLWRNLLGKIEYTVTILKCNYSLASLARSNNVLIVSCFNWFDDNCFVIIMTVLLLSQHCFYIECLQVCCIKHKVTVTALSLQEVFLTFLSFQIGNPKTCSLLFDFIVMASHQRTGGLTSFWDAAML